MKRKQLEFWIEQEEKDQYDQVEALVKEAFMELTDGDPTEHILVNRLRQGETFVADLSLVARNDQKIWGHILLTEIQIQVEDRNCKALSLAPVSVLPEAHGMGIGTALIEEAIQRAKGMGYGAIIVLGHPDYYPRFGFQPTIKWEIGLDLEDLPAEALMGLDLDVGYLEGCRGGMIQYPDVFFEGV
jgi:predicted N-acetyltransferase YhbS